MINTLIINNIINDMNNINNQLLKIYTTKL